MEKMQADGKRTLIIGASGRGKSTKAKVLCKDYNRLIVFDTEEEYARDPAYIPCEKLSHVRDVLKSNWNNKCGFKIAFVPEASAETTELHHLCKLLMHLQEPYKRGTDDRQIGLVVEEMDLSFPDTQLPRAINGQKSCALRGRKRGINMIGITQRPALVSTSFRGNADEMYVFGLATGNDYKAVASVIGKEHEPLIRELQPHEYIKWDSSGAISKGRNVLS